MILLLAATATNKKRNMYQLNILNEIGYKVLLTGKQV